LKIRQKEQGSAAISLTMIIASAGFFSTYSPLALAWILIGGGLLIALFGTLVLFASEGKRSKTWILVNVFALSLVFSGYKIRESQWVAKTEITRISLIRAESWTEKGAKFTISHKGLAIVTPEGYLVRFDGPVVPACLQEGARIRLTVTRWTNLNEVKRVEFLGCE